MMIPYCLIEMKTKDFVKRIQGFEFDRSNSRNPEWITNKEDAYFFSLFHKGKWKVSQRIVFEDVHKLTYLFLGEAFFSLKDQKIPYVNLVVGISRILIRSSPEMSIFFSLKDQKIPYVNLVVGIPD